jgi:hypothetical protein
MMIHFEFASYFSQYLGEKVHSIELAQNEAALEQVLDAFFKQHPAHERCFQAAFLPGRKDVRIVCLLRKYFAAQLRLEGWRSCKGRHSRQWWLNFYIS